MKTRSEKNKGILALILLSFIFASMGVFARYLQYDFSLLQQVYLRLSVAFFLGVLLFFKDIRVSRVFKIPKKDIGLIIFRAATLYGGVILISKAFFASKYSNVSFVASLPLLPIFGYFLLGEKLTFGKVFYSITAFVGLCLIAVKDLASIFACGEGEVLAALSAVAFSLSYIARKWQSDFLNNIELSIGMFFVGSLLVFAGSFGLLHEPLPALSCFTYPVLIMLLVAGFFNLANLTLTNYGFERVEVIVAGNILNLETLFALMIGIFIYGEIPIASEMLGGAIIATSVYRMNKII